MAEANKSTANAAPVAEADTAKTKHSVLNSKFPVLLPHDNALFLDDDEFNSYMKKIVMESRKPDVSELREAITAIESGEDIENLGERKRRASLEPAGSPPPKAPFMEGLKKDEAYARTKDDLMSENKTLTANEDVTNISSNDPLVDLFYDLGKEDRTIQLKTLLEDAWEANSLLTLKIIFNARSIHLGKSEKFTAYKALGWLADNHPMTLLMNLPWLVRPVIEKKAPKPDEEASGKTSDDADNKDSDYDMMEDSDAARDPVSAFDVRFGLSHGYWKDLLNLLVFAAHDELKVDGNQRHLINNPQDEMPTAKKRNWNPAKAKELRKAKIAGQHERVVKKLENDGLYRALHLTVTRLFGKQLKKDLALLNSGKKSDLKKLSLAAKWAPTFSEFHDKNTFVLSSIAEMLFPNPGEICPDASSRELYLRHAREAFRKTYSSPLRKELSIVEREIAARKFEDIKYERVPSLAMERYTPLFMKKDPGHFGEYIDKVAEGSSRISGANLLPSTLVSKARTIFTEKPLENTSKELSILKGGAKAVVLRKVVDGQWKTLVQRVKDSGTLSSSIAVCDVSASMTWDQMTDGTTPMDSAIGLSLLVAEVTAPPFGGALITFSAQPVVVSVGGDLDQERGFVDKVKYIEQTSWSSNTNFVAVFEDLILPMAQKNNVKPEDMVKQVFVFSDMQFDQANDPNNRWTSSYERIQHKYSQAGYDMPRLIFWNLAAKSSIKPTTLDDMNTALVSGYSQGMLKTFLSGGGFEDTDEEVIGQEDVEIEGEQGEEATSVTEVKVEKQMNALTLVRRAVSHKAYDMLEVFD